MNETMKTELIGIEKRLAFLDFVYSSDLILDKVSAEACVFIGKEIVGIKSRLSRIIAKIQTDDQINDNETQDRAIRQVIRSEVNNMMNEGLLMPGRVG